MKSNAKCECGSAQFSVSNKPLMRAYCHCTICQAFNQAPYADITLFKSSDVLKPKEGLADFKSHKFPPILQRGKCADCGKPVIEYLQAPMLELIVVPSNNIVDKSLLPEPSLHIFYHSRVKDIDDDLPKYRGYLRSQLAFGQKLMASLLRS